MRSSWRAERVSRRGSSPSATRHAPRAGIEGTFSQGVRAFGLRHARYRGLHKTHLQQVATATAIDLARLSDWLNTIPASTTRRSRFARLAPAS
jgi:transposase